MRYKWCDYRDISLLSTSVQAEVYMRICNVSHNVCCIDAVIHIHTLLCAVADNTVRFDLTITVAQ
jgi:hypothetical protein